MISTSNSTPFRVHTTTTGNFERDVALEGATTLTVKPTTIISIVLCVVPMASSQSSPIGIADRVPGGSRYSSVALGNPFGSVRLDVCWGHERPNTVAL